MRHGTLRQAVRWRRHVSLCLVLVFVRCVTAQSAVIQFAIPGDIDWRTAQQPPFSPASYFPGIDYALSTTGIAPLDTTLVIDVPTLPADITVGELGPQEWANVSGFAAHLARDDVYAVTNVIDDGDTLVYSGQLLIAAGEGLPISPASIRQLTESGVDQVRVMVNLAHAVLWSRNPQTRFESLLWSPTLFEGQLNDQQLRTNLEHLIDADPSTAFVRVDGLNRVVEKRSVVIRMDLVSRLPVGLVRFYPRPRAGNGSLTISGYSIDVNDGINLKPAPTGQLSRVTNATYELLGDEALRSDGVPRYELLQTGQGNDLDTVSVVIYPPQYLRFLQFNSLTALDFDVAEREVFNQGFPPLVTYLTRPLPFNSVAVTTMLDYQGGNLDRRAELDALPGATLGRVFWDERSIGDAARSGAVVSMRTGITPEPLLLWRVNGNGDAVEWRTDTHVVDYRDDSPTRNQSVWLDDPLLRSSSRSIWEALPAVERVVAQTTFGEYIRLPAATRRDQNGDALPRVVDHSSWGGGFQPLENGQVMSAPGGRPFFSCGWTFPAATRGRRPLSRICGSSCRYLPPSPASTRRLRRPLT